MKTAGWLVGFADARSFLLAIVSTLPAQLGGAPGTLASFEQLAPGRSLEPVGTFARELDP